MNWEEYIEREKNKIKKREVESDGFQNRKNEYKILKSSNQTIKNKTEQNFNNPIIRSKINLNSEEEKKDLLVLIKKLENRNYSLVNENDILKKKILELDKENENLKFNLKNNEKIFIKFENIKIYIKQQQEIIETLKNSLNTKDEEIKQLVYINKKMNNLKKELKDANYDGKEKFDDKKIDILSNDFCDPKKSDLHINFDFDWNKISGQIKNKMFKNFCENYIQNDEHIEDLIEMTYSGKNELKNFTFKPT